MMTFKTEDDLSVWERFLSGDSQAYEYIYRQHVGKLFLYGTALTSDEELVKDCIHDVFIHIYKNRKNLGKTNNIRLYLMTSLKNAIRMAYRKRNITAAHESLTEEKEEETVIDRMIGRETELELKARVDRVWSVLTPRQKEIVYYRFVEGMSLPDIAEVEHMNYQSIANIIQRALKKMRNFYSQSE